jgi:hypothetical protein
MCEKGYARMSEFQAHESSYDHSYLVAMSPLELRETVDTEYYIALLEYFGLPLNPHQPLLTLTPSF